MRDHTKLRAFVLADEVALQESVGLCGAKRKFGGLRTDFDSFTGS